MKKVNSSKSIRILITLCTLALPSATLYSQHLSRTIATNKTLTKKNPRSPLTIKEKKDTQEEKEEEEEENSSPIEPTQSIKTTTKKIRQSTTKKPSTWATIYSLLPQIFMQSFSTGSDIGIGAFTKIVTKQFVQKYTFTRMKNTAFNDLEQRLQSLPEKDKQGINEEDKLLFVKTYFQQNKLNFDQLEQQTASSVIFGTAASTALIYTASAMMGALMKFGIGISLQLLMPQK